jgi:hypothetical protein
MTMTRRKNSISELPIYSRSMISRPIVFLGWSCNRILTCLICCGDTDCFCLKSWGKISYFDCHRRFLPSDHPFRLDSNSFRKDNVVL